ncbi:MAG TPA: carbohydrate ABC transporter permease [Anaerovoracaceae bacterium]|nr:carbohydrate ABC transporter permease [Anaerovoracaceae bacterium]
MKSLKGRKRCFLFDQQLHPAQLLILIILAFCAVYPFFMILITSFKTRGDYLTAPLGFPKPWTFENYVNVYETADIFRALLNSVILTAGSIAGQLIFGSMAAYAIAKTRLKRKKTVTAAFLLPLFLPIQTVIIPLYVFYTRLNLNNSLFGLMLIYIAGGLPLVILSLSSFMNTIPNEISEAAFIDGLSHFQTYYWIILPLLRPAVAAVVILSGLSIWNDFYLPLLMLTDVDQATLPVKIYLFTGEYSNQWPKICVCIVFLVIPILTAYFFFQKQIISGIAAGAVKG